MDSEAVPDFSAKMIAFLESGDVPEGLSHPDVFLDLSMPTWRIQTQCLEDGPGAQRQSPCARQGHRFPHGPDPNRIRAGVRGTLGTRRPVLVCPRDATHGHHRRPDHQLTVYCTGDWDEVRQQEFANRMTLVRT